MATQLIQYPLHMIDPFVCFRPVVMVLVTASVSTHHLRTHSQVTCGIWLWIMAPGACFHAGRLTMSSSLCLLHVRWSRTVASLNSTHSHVSHHPPVSTIHCTHRFFNPLHRIPPSFRPERAVLVGVLADRFEVELCAFWSASR